MEESRASESTATDETMSLRIDAVGDVLKTVSSDVVDDETMKDVDSNVSDGGHDVVMYVDLVCDDKVSFRDGSDGRKVVDLPPDRVFEQDDGDDLAELSVSISGSDVRDEDSEGEGVDHFVSPYDSLLTKFDNYASGGGSGYSRASTFGFQVGDLVWGKVKSHPWWPGHIFNEAFALPSVRRMRREGHILVAFFGDSSYGWFHPAQLVPFDDNFEEKSRQTSAKAFVKAVEEAVDEMCRRRSLGISCRCRNLHNFRPADEEGYFAVDLVDYDYVAVYPQRLIDRARDRFQPLETIKFISQLAKKPLDCDHKSLVLSENKAVVMQLRKSMFEEFDDTYSEAFGYPPDRPIRAPKNLGGDSLRMKAQAQLSGPLVIAEALHGKKNSAKSAKSKMKDRSNKNTYVLKRRDENDVSKESQFRDRQFKSSAPLSYVEEESELASGDYVLQRRSPAPSAKLDLLPSENMESLDQTILKPSFKKEIDTLNGIKAAGEYGIKAAGELHEATNIINIVQRKAEEATNLKRNENAQVTQHVGVHEKEKNSRTVEESHKMQPVDHGSHPGTKDVGFGSNKKVVMKKPKTPKRSIGDLNSDLVNQEEKKTKKKIKKEAVDGRPVKKVLIGKSGPVSYLDDGKEKERTSTLLHGVVVNQPLDPSANTNLKFRDVLSDLKNFALDPFHGAGAERNSPVVAMEMFLKFRSLVFQKSLALAPTGESDSINAEIRKSAIISIVPDTANNVNIKDKPIKKLARPLGRPEDPTKGGRKRPLSDRQDEIATKKSKKISDIKSVANEKKAGRKEKETSILGKPEISKFVPPPRRVQPPPRVPEPTMLVLKFPQGTAMPTAAALKARFARFGPLDLDSLRVFWQSSTCRVVFRYKADAQKAYEFAVSNTSLFGNKNIRCQLREVEVQEPETKEETEEAYTELPRYDPPLPLFSPMKSILKKSSSDPSRASVRVKFVLDGEASTGGEPAPVTASRNFVDGNKITTSTSVGMDYNSRNMQKVIQSSSSVLPSTYMPAQHQFTLQAPPQTVHHSEAPTNMYYHSNHGGGVMPASSGTATGSVDISQQMISMLTRCNEVVTNIKAHLGYVPYHSL